MAKATKSEPETISEDDSECFITGSKRRRIPKPQLRTSGPAQTILPFQPSDRASSSRDAVVGNVMANRSDTDDSMFEPPPLDPVPEPIPKT